jgi:hypothetical protein
MNTPPQREALSPGGVPLKANAISAARGWRWKKDPVFRLLCAFQRFMIVHRTMEYLPACSLQHNDGGTDAGSCASSLPVSSPVLSPVRKNHMILYQDTYIRFMKTIMMHFATGPTHENAGGILA